MDTFFAITFILSLFAIFVARDIHKSRQENKKTGGRKK
jgi:hypothetical protein